MPMYDFYCKVCDESEERLFGFNDKHEVTCDVCANLMEKIITPVGVIFRGTGWAGRSS